MRSKCRSALEEARAFLRATVLADACLFTASGTEAANAVLFHGWKKDGKKKHFVVSLYEHPAVYECARALEEMGHSMTWLRPDRQTGTVSPEAVAEAVREDTALVAVMHVNNETGAVNDVAALAKAAKAKNPADAFLRRQGAGLPERFPFTMGAVDYYSVSAHKLHALKGTGALFYQKSAPLSPSMLGGGQENLLRSGTENTFGILAFYEAAKSYLENHHGKALPYGRAEGAAAGVIGA